MTPAALLADNVSHPSASVARPRTRRNASYQPLQFPYLMELLDLFGASDVPSTHKNAGEARIFQTRDSLKLIQELGVHRQISFIYLNAETPEYGSDSAAILEGFADDAEAGEVKSNGRRRRKRRRRKCWISGGPSAEDGCGDPNPSEKGWATRLRVAGPGIEFFTAKGLNVFERGA